MNPKFWYSYYYYESIFIVSLVLFMLILYRGSQKNLKIARRHFRRLAVELRKYFKNVGSNNRELFEKDNAHCFKMYASSHAVMKFCLVGIYV